MFTPALKHVIRPPLTALSNILFKLSIIKRNGKGDNEFPCLRPLELLKKPVGDPKTKIENCTVEIQ